MQEFMMKSMKKLKAPQNLTALAYKSIKAHILQEELDETTRLTEELLSRQLGISKSLCAHTDQARRWRGRWRRYPVAPQRVESVIGSSHSEDWIRCRA
jgi:hypothetical protein